MYMSPRGSRPLGITIIAIVVGIQGIFTIIAGLQFLGTITIILGVLTLLLAWGLWTLQSWAFWTAVVLEVIDLINDPDEIFNWPWVYAVEVGHWELTDAQCKLLREYLLRGGFLMVDDFHGTLEWGVFTQSMSKIFPDRPIVELPDADPIFHTVYDLDHRLQVPGLQYLYSGRIYEKDGTIPHWRAIYDDDGRVMVAMCFNQDDGDAWEHADNPQYEAKYTSQAYRLGINYVIYSMTH